MQISSKIKAYKLGITKHSNQPYMRCAARASSQLAGLDTSCTLSACRTR